MKLLILLALALAGCDYNTVPPELAAADFAQELGVTLRGKPTCAAVDTDCDDYVTCTINAVDGDAARFVSLQCAATHVAPNCIRGEALGCKLTAASGDLPNRRGQ